MARVPIEPMTKWEPCPETANIVDVILLLAPSPNTNCSLLLAEDLAHQMSDNQGSLSNAPS